MRQNGHRVPGPDRRRQILAVSAELFAQRGFRGTTTREIAERARVNEAILFRHFPRKQDLYWAVLDGKTRAAAGQKHLEQLFEAGGSDEEIFASIAEGILRRNTQDPSLSRLLFFSALEDHRLSRRFFQTYLEGYYAVLARHIRGRIREGVFRAVDPLLAARGFLGMVAYHFQMQELFGDRRYRAVDLRRVSRSLAGIWVQGMRVHRRRIRVHSHDLRAARASKNVRRHGRARIGRS